MEVLRNIFKNNLWKSLKMLACRHKYPLVLTFVFCTFLSLFWGKFGDPIVDCGREAYIPYAMANLGKILFKDIICIYGPLPYYLNALAVSLFGPSLNVFYFIGALLSYVFLLIFFKLAKRFFGAPEALLMTLVVLFLCVFSPGIFNYIFPYSYATLYALVFSLFSIFFIFKFIERKNPLNLYAAALFISFAVLSKYDFLPLILLLPVAMWFYRKDVSKKTIFYSVFCFFVPFLILAIILAVQGVCLSDLAFNFKMISNMAHSETLKFFYDNCTGFTFSAKKFLMAIKPFGLSLFGMSLIFSCAYFLCKIQNKVLKIVLTFLLIMLGVCLLHPSFFFYPFFVLLFLAFLLLNAFYRKLFGQFDNREIEKFLFLFFTLLISLKSLFGLIVNVYGTFYFPCVFLSFYIILKTLFAGFVRVILRIDFVGCKNKFNYALNSLNIVLLIIFFCNTRGQFAHYITHPVKTPAGTIFSYATYSAPVNSLLEFLKNNLKNDDEFLVLPEGLFFNFVLQKPYPYYNTSFIPLDFDAYGEEYLINNVLKNRPKYLIMTNRDSSDYGKAFICQDYGQKFCASFSDLYLYRETFGLSEAQKPFLIHVFERKE